MKLSERTTITALEWGFIGLFLFAIGGWVANIVKVLAGLSEPLTGLFALRLVGIVAAPLGAILGYF